MTAPDGLPDALTALAANFVARAGDTDEARAWMHTILATYLRHALWTPEFERALASADRFRAVSDLTAKVIADGADPDEVRRWLNGFHLALLSEHRDEEDDVVLEVLDELAGF